MTTPATRYTVTRRDNHTLMTHRTAEEFAGAWVDVSTDGAPRIGEVAARFVTDAVTDRRHEGGDPVQWHAGSGHPWDAITRLHRAGHDAEATELAELLRWCDRRATGRDVAIWTLTTAAPAATSYVFRPTATEDSKGVNLAARRGSTVALVEWVTDPDDRFDAEVLPMAVVRFEDGVTTDAFPDELTPA